jgi:N-acetylmuramoyl-L-alanine amidase CwlA
MLEITQKLIPSPSKRRSGIKISRVDFLVAHDTGNDGSTALQNATYFVNSANDIEASAHYFIDDKQIICCVPETEKAWHVRYGAPNDNYLLGKNANDYSISVELCYDSKKIKIDNLAAYKNYIDLIRDICKRHGLDPRTKIAGHFQLDPGRRTDPLNAFSFIGKTWTAFIEDVIGTTAEVELIKKKISILEKMILILRDLLKIVK